MEIRNVSENIAIYSDGQRLQVIHDLGDEFVIDVEISSDTVYNIDGFAVADVREIKPYIRVLGFCARYDGDMQRLRRAISQFEDFVQYIKDNHKDLVDWLEKLEKDKKDD